MCPNFQGPNFQGGDETNQTRLLGCLSCKLKFGRRLRLQLDLVKPDAGKTSTGLSKKGNDAPTKPKLVKGLPVMYWRSALFTHNYAQEPKWVPGTVVETKGQVLLHIKNSVQTC